MSPSTQHHPGPAWNPVRVTLGVVLLVIGLAGHLLAANVEGGRPIHYRHHLFGFFLLSIVSALVMLALGRFFWRGRHDVTLLIVGAVQAVLGLLIYASFANG